MKPGSKASCVLIVEDSPTQRSQYVEGLRQAGFAAEGVESATAALTRLRQTPTPAVVIVDWEMPGMNGVQLIGLMQSMRFRVRPMVLMLTQKADTNSLTTALDRGAHDYLKKPIETAELAARVGAGIRSYHLHAELVDKIGELEELLRQDSAKAHREEEQTSTDVQRTVEPRALVIKAALDVLARVGLPPKSSLQVAQPVAHDYVGWAALAVPTMSRWLDIRVEADTEMLGAMARGILGEKDGSGIRPHDLMAEVANLVRGHTQSNLLRYGHKALTAVPSRCLDSKQLGTLEEAEAPKHYAITLEEGCVGITVASNIVDIRELGTGQLRPGLLLAESLRRRSAPQSVLLHAGTLLTERIIERLAEVESRESERLVVTAVEPSPFTNSALSIPPLSIDSSGTQAREP